jgi:hypothetical protein
LTCGEISEILVAMRAIRPLAAFASFLLVAQPALASAGGRVPPKPADFATIESKLATVRAAGNHQQSYRACLEIQDLLKNDAWPDSTREQRAAIAKCVYEGLLAASDQYLSEVTTLSYDEGLQRIANVQRQTRDRRWILSDKSSREDDMTEAEMATEAKLIAEVIPRGLDLIAATHLKSADQLVRDGKYYQAAMAVHRLMVDTQSPVATAGLAAMMKVAAAASTANAQTGLPATQAFYSWRAELYGAKPVEKNYDFWRSVRAADVTLDLQVGACKPAEQFTWTRVPGAKPVAIRLELLGSCNVSDVAMSESTTTNYQTYLDYVDRVVVDENRTQNAPKVTRTAITKTVQECARYQSSSSYMGESCSTSPGSDTRVCRPNVDPNPKSTCVEWKSREVETGEYNETSEAVQDTVTTTSRTVREQVTQTESYEVKLRRFDLTIKAKNLLEGDGIRLQRDSPLTLSKFDREYSSVHAGSNSFSFQAADLVSKNKVYDALRTEISKSLEQWQSARASAIVANLPAAKADRLDSVITAEMLAPGDCSKIALLADIPVQECKQIMNHDSKLALEEYRSKDYEGTQISWPAFPTSLGEQLTIARTRMEYDSAVRLATQAEESDILEFRNQTENRNQTVGIGAVAQRGNGIIGSNATALLFAVHADQQFLDVLSPVSLQGMFGFEIGTNFGDRVPYDMYLGLRPGLRLSIFRLGFSGVVGFNGFKDKNEEAQNAVEKASHVEPAAYAAAGPYLALRTRFLTAEFGLMQQKRTGVQPRAARFEARFTIPKSTFELGGFWDVRGFNALGNFAEVTKVPQSIIGVWLAIRANK